MTNVVRQALEISLKDLVEKSTKTDVLIIGSATPGVTAAVALAEKKKGLNIVIVEAGPLTILERAGSSSV